MITRIRIAVRVVATAFILVGTAAGVSGWLFLSGQPAWYRLASRSPTAGGTAEQMEAKLIHLYNRVAAVHAWRVRQGQAVGRPAGSRPATRRSPAAEQPFEITLTDVELNAFFDKWADTAGRRQAFSAYVEDPRLQVRPGELILAAKVKSLHTVLSLELAPRLDADGRLRMNLRRVSGGVLPLPEALWGSERDRLVRMLDEKYAQIEPAVEINPDGTANEPASASAMNRLLVATLRHQSADPVVFLPYDLGRMNRTVPTHVQGLRLGDGTITLNVREMNAAERNALRAAVHDHDTVAQGMVR